jgi:Uncharacterized protein conserved in bacteria
MKRILSLAALVALSACGQSVDKPADPSATASVAVTDAWCRTSPNGAKAGGCFATFLASTDDRLVGGSTPRAAQLQIHEMSTSDGMMKMGEMKDGLPLAAGETISLAPGGNHVMLIGLTQPLAEGETVPLTLRFASAPEVTVQAQVRTPPVGGGMAGMDHGAH